MASFSYQPTVVHWAEYLDELINWERFAIYLPGIEQHHVDKITKDCSGLDNSKTALYSEWTRIYPQASWNHVLEALKKTKQINLAEKIEKLLERDLARQQSNALSNQTGTAMNGTTTGVLHANINGDTPDTKDKKNGTKCCSYSYVCVLILALIIGEICYSCNNGLFQYILKDDSVIKDNVPIETSSVSFSSEEIIKISQTLNDVNTKKTEATSTPKIKKYCITDLNDILNALETAYFSSSDWLKLGLELGLYYNTLRSIKADNRGNSDDCLRECITKWLQRADNVDSKGGPTASVLINAVRNIDKAAGDLIQL